MVKIRVIPTGVVEHEAEALGHAAGEWIVHVARLTSVLVERHLVSRRGAGTGSPRGADFAPGFVAQFQYLRAVCVGGQGSGTQMIR